MALSVHLALDLGAESGRAMLGVLAGQEDDPRLALHELRRFQTPSFSADGVLHWDFAAIRAEVLTSLAAAARRCADHGLPLASIGVDTWGVDYGLLGPEGTLVEPPRCYREPSHQRGFEIVKERIGLDRLYARTGIHPMAINTISQLAAQREQSPEVLNKARSLLFMPDLLHHFLSGRAANEATIASTSQMVDAATGSWADDVLAPLGIPGRLLGEIVQPGAVLGTLLPGIAAKTGLPAEVQVIAPASHDTAGAVAAIPVEVIRQERDDWCYLSSGTWSLMGVERTTPILSDAAHRAGFTNERGLGDQGAKTIRFLKNITGLWLLQGVRADLIAAGQDIDYPRLSELASKSEPFRTRVDIDDPALGAPGNMIEKLRAQARSHGDPAPETPGDLARACLEALALSYRRTLHQLEGLLGRRIRTIYLVGGGGRNTLLNQMTADAAGRQVVVGPYEAAAAGNVLVQALGARRIARPAEIRRIVAASSIQIGYAPRNTSAWERADAWYEQITG